MNDARLSHDGTQAAMILLVEDDEDSREMMKEYFESLGFRVEEAATGPDAVERGLSLRPSVVLLDMTLPGLGGLEVAARLRGDPTTRDIPLVALTGRELAAADRQRFDGVVMKPADLGRLRALVEQLAATPGPTARAL